VSHRTRNGRVPASSAGTSTPAACSTMQADHGAPPTLRRSSMYSIGFETRSRRMLSSSHVDSSSKCRVTLWKRSRQSRPEPGVLRRHRSSSPFSTGFVGSGTGSDRSTGMNRRSRSRYSRDPSWSRVRLYCARKWSSKKKTHTYQSVTRLSSVASQSGWVYAHISP